MKTRVLETSKKKKKKKERLFSQETLNAYSYATSSPVSSDYTRNNNVIRTPRASPSYFATLKR